MPRLGAAGIAVAVILAQANDRIAQAVTRAGASYPFPICGDPDRVVIKRYGVWHPIGIDAFNTAHPAAFLIDPARRLRYAFVGSTQFARAPLAKILAATGAAADVR